MGSTMTLEFNVHHT